MYYNMYYDMNYILPIDISMYNTIIYIFKLNNYVNKKNVRLNNNWNKYRNL